MAECQAYVIPLKKYPVEDINDNSKRLCQVSRIKSTKERFHSRRFTYKSASVRQKSSNNVIYSRRSLALRFSTLSATNTASSGCTDRNATATCPSIRPNAVYCDTTHPFSIFALLLLSFAPKTNRYPTILCLLCAALNKLTMLINWLYTCTTTSRLRYPCHHMSSQAFYSTSIRLRNSK